MALPAAQDEARITIAVKAVLKPQRRLIGWAYVTHKADGSLAIDSGGTTTVNGKVVEGATDQDIVDTPEALKALEDSFYDFVSSGTATADDMHVDFGVAKIKGGIFFTPEVSKALGIPEGTLPTGALCVIDIPETPRGDQLWADVESGKKGALSSVVLIEREVLEDAA